MRKLTLGVGLAVLLCVAQRADALTDMSVVANAPGTTLLLPYFEIDPNGTASSGSDTLIQLNNASATAILNHVTVWTDLAVPVMSFQIYLTGYDLETIDLAQVLAGHLPRTASAGQEPPSPNQDTISPHGPVSQDINFASCTGILPPPDTLSADFVAHVRASLTGQSSAVLGGCAGRNLGDGLMRGYVTIDTVNSCSLLLPGSVGYIETVLTVQNVMWATYRTIDRGTKRTIEGSLVNIRGSFSDPEVTTNGQYTFYGRLTQPTKFSAVDHRQPLGTTYGARFVNASGAAFPTSTSLIVWRDPKVAQSAFACGTNPPWYPLGQESLAVFDEQEGVDVAEVDPVAPVTPGAVLTPFPAATQKVRVGGPDLPVGFERGWIYMNLNTTVVGSPNPPEDTAAAQAWVDVINEDKDPGAYGVRARTSTVTPGMPFDSATDTFHQIIPVP
jgi:hypothetical protein